MFASSTCAGLFPANPKSLGVAQAAGKSGGQDAPDSVTQLRVADGSCEDNLTRLIC